MGFRGFNPHVSNNHIDNHPNHIEYQEEAGFDYRRQQSAG
jgi:hypothetical protein